MDTISLCRFACGDKFIRKGFAGVFALDTLPKFKNKFISFIINLDPVALPGSHWVAVYFRNTESVYFDSYGRPPPTNILKFLEINSKEVSFNEFCLQDFSTLTCGYFCLYFLYNQSRKLSLKKLKQDDTLHNEKVIERFSKTKLKLGKCCHSFHDRPQNCAALINMSH